MWQAQTFGFHLAELEIRQHASVHARAVDELAPEAAGDAAALDRLATEAVSGGTPPLVSEDMGEAAAEVLATLRAMARIQRRFGADACRRYVVSFTRLRRGRPSRCASWRGSPSPTARSRSTSSPCSSRGRTWRRPQRSSTSCSPTRVSPGGSMRAAGGSRSCSATRTPRRTWGRSQPISCSTGPSASSRPGRGATTWSSRCFTVGAAPWAAAAAPPGGPSEDRRPGRSTGASRSPSRARSRSSATEAGGSPSVTWNRSRAPC